MTSRQAPEELHPALLGGWQLAQKVRTGLLNLIRPLTTVQWAFRPGPRGWSIAEQVDHLLRAEIGSSKMVRKLIRGDYRSQRIPPGASLYTASLDHYPYGRLEAPRDLVPGSLRERGKLERELGVVHARFRLELSEFRGDDPEALQSPDPATGVWFTLGGWVKLQGWHEAHHLGQIQDIVNAGDFSR